MDIKNNTAFYRRIKSEYDIKYWQKYPKYFCLPPYLYRDHHTKVSVSTTTSKKDCVKHNQVPKGGNISSITANHAETSSKKITKSSFVDNPKSTKGALVHKNKEDASTAPLSAIF